MNGQGALIFLITALVVAAIAAGLFIDLGKSVRPDTELPQATAEIISAIGFNNSDQETNRVRIQVRVTDGVVRINDTLIVLSTDEGSAQLQYRDGTLERNVTEGYYTQ